MRPRAQSRGPSWGGVQLEPKTELRLGTAPRMPTSALDTEHQSMPTPATPAQSMHLRVISH